MHKSRFTTHRTNNIDIGNGQKMHRVLYKVRRRTCCFLEIYPDYYRVSIGKPSDTETLSFRYPKDEHGMGYSNAIQKAVSIAESSADFYDSVLKQ